MDKDIVLYMMKNQKYQNGSEVQKENDEINSPKKRTKQTRTKKAVKYGDKKKPEYVYNCYDSFMKHQD